jgi:hypothetical protein
MEDGVEGILPALVLQAGREAVRPLRAIFDEAVAVGVAGVIDPGESALDRRP